MYELSKQFRFDAAHTLDRVVQTESSRRIHGHSYRGEVTLRRREYASEDLQGVFLVIGATDDEGLNQRISADAEDSSLLCNIADRPEKCNFILPAVVQRGELVLTVSTSGRSPALA